MTTFPPSTFSKPSISLEKVVKNEDFVILTLTSLFTLFSWLWGPQKRSLRTLLEPLGASWWCLGELLGAPLGILGAFLGGKASKMPSRTPKTSPRPPQDLPQSPPRGSPGPPRSLQTALPQAPEGPREAIQGATMKERR